MFGPRFGYGFRYGHAGAGFARFLSFLCPMLLVLEALAIVAGLPSRLVQSLWIGLIVALALSAAFALVLLVFGPWRNRFAGAWLGVVAGGTYWLSGPANAWATYFSRYF